MADGKTLLQRAIILVMLLGVNGLFGNQGSSSPSQEDPAATDFVNIMKKQLKRDSNNKHKIGQHLPEDLSNNKVVRNFVFRRFKAEMQYMFSFLPKKNRCEILASLSVSTKCNLTGMMNILVNESILKTSQDLNCFTKRTLLQPQCGVKDTIKVIHGFWIQMGRLFNNVSVPFQCNIINRIATASLRYHHQKQHLNTKTKAPRLTLQTAEKQLEFIFPHLNIKGKCSKVWKPLKKLVPLRSPASLMNLTIKLKAGIKRKDWLRNLKGKAYKIYKIYYYHFYKSKRQRPLIPKDRSPSNPPLLKNDNVKLAVLRVTKVDSKVSVVFGLEVRKPRSYVYSRISPAKFILVALKQLEGSALNSFFNATVIKLTGAQQKTIQTKYIWSMQQIMETKRQFPKYLVGYYRKLDRLGKCLVMLYISSSLQMNLRPVELLYNTFKYVPRKYFCSSKRRSLNSPVANRTHFYMENRQPKPAVESTVFPNAIKPTTTKDEIVLRVKPNQTNTSKGVEEFPEKTEEEPEKEVTPLEIGLFAILALLCLAILAFTVNCILFAIKKNKKSPQLQQTNSAFARAILRKENDSASTEDQQHVMVIMKGQPNLVENLPRHGCHGDGPPTNTSEQCEDNKPRAGEVILSKEEISLHSDGNSLNSSLDKKDKSSEDGSESQQVSEDRIDLPDSDNNCSEHCSYSQRTNSQSSISLSVTLDTNSAELAPEPSQRTLKECSGELEVILDSNNDYLRSASSNHENDPVLKNTTKKLLVHLDQNGGIDKETVM